MAWKNVGRAAIGLHGITRGHYARTNILPVHFRKERHVSDLVDLACMNAVTAAVVTPVAVIATRGLHVPRWAHAIWLLVLVGLVVPPVLPVSWSRPDAVVAPVEHLVQRTQLTVGSALVLVWLTGSTLILGNILIQTARFLSRMRGARNAPDAVDRKVRALAKTLGLSRVPRTLIIDGPFAPAVFGIGPSQRIVLPGGLVESLRPERLDAVLAHELTHIYRRDLWVRALELTVSVLYWWHPAVWIARRELHRAREACCDALVVETWPECRRAYAAAIIDTLDHLAIRPDRSPVRVALTDGGEVRQRIVRILNDDVGCRPGARLLMSAAILLVSLPLAPSMAQQNGARWSVDARDPAGAFRLEFDGEDLVHVAIDDQSLARERWVHEPGRLSVFDEDGRLGFFVEVCEERRSIRWDARPSVSTRGMR